MRVIIACSIALVTTAAALGQPPNSKVEPIPQPIKKGEPVPPPAGSIKTDFSFFEYWGLHLKSFSLDVVERKLLDGRIANFGRITYVLEFERDIPFLQLEPLQRNLGPFGIENKKLHHLFFDHENVALNGNRFLPYTIQGEVSGLRGESFRITSEFLDDPRASILNTKKLVVRVPLPDLPIHAR